MLIIHHNAVAITTRLAALSSKPVVVVLLKPAIRVSRASRAKLANSFIDAAWRLSLLRYWQSLFGQLANTAVAIDGDLNGVGFGDLTHPAPVGAQAPDLDLNGNRAVAGLFDLGVETQQGADPYR